MSIQDTATKQYVSEAEVFADAFNYLIYDGEQVIKPEQLTDMDTTQYVIPYHEDEKGKPEAAQKYRDTLKTLAVKTDDRYTYLVLGIENQSHVHYAMPVRNMLYDSMQYSNQVETARKSHKQAKKYGTHDMIEHSSSIFLIYFAAITPFISGMDISIITISFFCSPHMATASLPFTA